MGLCLGFFTTYGTVTIPSSLSWRLPLALHSAIAFVLMIASTFYLPESPRWLSYKGRKQEASKAWDTLGVSGAEREKDLLLNSAGSGPTGEPVEAVVSTHPAVPKKTLRSRMRGNYEDIAAIFKKDVRKPTLLGIFLMSMQQLSGIDGVIYVRTLCDLSSFQILEMSLSLQAVSDTPIVCTASLSAGRPQLVRS